MERPSGKILDGLGNLGACMGTYVPGKIRNGTACLVWDVWVTKTILVSMGIIHGSTGLPWH